MKTIKLIEKYCPKCNKYVGRTTVTPKENFERCLTCHSKLTYAVALYHRAEIKNPNFNKDRFFMYKKR